jgi:hypothetical protein
MNNRLWQVFSGPIIIRAVHRKFLQYWMRSAQSMIDTRSAIENRKFLQYWMRSAQSMIDTRSAIENRKFLQFWMRSAQSMIDTRSAIENPKFLQFWMRTVQSSNHQIIKSINSSCHFFIFSRFSMPSTCMALPSFEMLLISISSPWILMIALPFPSFPPTTRSSSATLLFTSRA